MKKVVYLRDVPAWAYPEPLIAKRGDERELEDEDAEKLVADGYVEIQKAHKDKHEKQPEDKHKSPGKHGE